MIEVDLGDGALLGYDCIVNSFVVDKYADGRINREYISNEKASELISMKIKEELSSFAEGFDVVQ